MSQPILTHHGMIPGRLLPARLHIAPHELAGLLLTITGLLPTAMVVTWAADGRAGVRRLLGRMLRWRIGVRWWLLVLAGLPVLTVGLALLFGDSLESIESPRSSSTRWMSRPSWSRQSVGTARAAVACGQSAAGNSSTFIAARIGQRAGAALGKPRFGRVDGPERGAARPKHEPSTEIQRPKIAMRSSWRSTAAGPWCRPM